MTDKLKKLSDTTRALLAEAAMCADHLIRPPKLPTAAARLVARSLLNAGFAEEVTGFSDPSYAWRTGDGGAVLMGRATATGLKCVREVESTTSEVAAAETYTAIAAKITETRVGAAGGLAVAAAPTTPWRGWTAGCPPPGSPGPARRLR
jgi:hypothetical protein